MQIKARVTAGANRNEVIKDGNIYRLKVTESPVDGKANKMVIKLLAKELEVRKNDIQILKGQKGRDKIISILD